MTSEPPGSPASGSKLHRPARQLALWVAAAVAASAVLVAVLHWETGQTLGRWSSLVEGRTPEGRKLFQQKGCSSCHTGEEGAAGPDLAAVNGSRPGPDCLITAMWNHAPKMWGQMRQAGVTAPTFNEQQMADLLAYLYTLRYIGVVGDRQRGERVFSADGCISCHSVRGKGGHAAADLSGSAASASAIAWATAMWNHPSARGRSEDSRFSGSDMNDLLGYVRGEDSPLGLDRELLNADFDRGWNVFREKSCVACHAIRSVGRHVGPDLGPGREMPPTVVQLAGSIWNHSPAMWQTMEHMHIERSAMLDREMADLVAFFYSFRYVEPGGSAKVGELLFETRGCSRCHGQHAMGTPQGPRLLGRGRNYNCVVLATALWRHGPSMYRSTQNLGLPWPSLAETDVGDLITFLNTAPGESRQ
jgi:mono/diheme cytochrome c family protein